MKIIRNHTRSEWRTATKLVDEYVRSLGADLAFQNYDGEIADLPSQYDRPDGCLLLAQVDDAFVGCVGVRRLGDNACEMKRLYVQQRFRGQGIGKALAITALEEARALGYHSMRLDTWPSMEAARGLYERLGFHEIPPYRRNPVEGTSYMELTL